jgi:hypothetical protein
MSATAPCCRPGGPERCVDTVIAEAKTAIARSRRSTIIAAFSIASAIFLGAVVSWFAASEAAAIVTALCRGG